MPREDRDELSRRFRNTAEISDLRGEIKWQKVSAKKLEAYKRLVDFFFDQVALKFRVILVDGERLNYMKYHDNDQELGFYRFYYEMLVKWLLPQHEYLILLDYKQNASRDRYTTLKYHLERSTKGVSWISDLTIINSRQTPLAQLTDLLVGACAAEWGNTRPESAKAELVRYIVERRNTPAYQTASASPRFEKFNIFCIRLNEN